MDDYNRNKLAQLGLSPPGGGVEGDFWWDNVNHKAKFHDGTSVRTNAFSADINLPGNAAQSGEWIPPSGITNNQGILRVAGDQSTMHLSCVVIDRTTTVNAIGCYVGAAAVGGTSMSMRMGWYADDGTGTRPTGAALLDAGTVGALTNVGIKSAALTSTLQPGVYWMACAFQFTAAPTTYPNMNCWNGGIWLPSTSFNTPSRGYSMSGVSGALPTISALSYVSSPILVQFKKT